MTAIIIIGIIIFIIYAATSKEKHTNNPNYKKSNVSKTINQRNRMDANLMKENETTNLKIIDNIRLKCRSLAEIIEITYESNACPKCNGRKMNFSNVAPTGQFITCQCTNCSKVQTFKLIAGKNGSKVIQVRDEIKHLMESIILPINDDYWKIDIDYSFMVNSEIHSIPSKNNVTGNLDLKEKSDSIINILNIKAEHTIYVKENPSKVVLYNFEGKVPYWENRVITSHKAINNIDFFQQTFYNQFKTRFLNEDYIDLQGNTNYAFILYFELLADYTKHGDIDKLEKQLLILAECYPSTKQYIIKSLADTKLMQENMSANLKIADNIRIKCRSLAEIIERSYESKVCPKCNERKMIFLNVEPTGQSITCECSNCNRFQTLKLSAGKNGSEALQVYDEIEYLEKSVKRPVTEDFWDIDVDFSFMVIAETDSNSSMNSVTDNLDSRMKSDSIIEKVNIKDEPAVSIKENPQRIVLCNFEGKVPYWENRNIYSHTEINDADISQIIFYNLFKTRFLNGDYFDLQGNGNYAFILYFDLKVDYTKHRDVELLEKQLLTLAECYPNTKRIVFNTLANECVLKGESKRAEKMQAGLMNEYDNSITDITPLSYKINLTNNLQKYDNGVPNWAHHYVYSYSELYSATSEQSRFYSAFKEYFFKGEYLDLEGNTNYAFILMFDLLKDYDNNLNVSEIERKLHILGQYYPKTKSYGIAFLQKRMIAKQDNEGIARLQFQNKIESQNNYIENNYRKLGSIYKTKLDLNDDEVNLLDKQCIYTAFKGFFKIVYCCQETIKLFLSTIKQFKNDCIEDGTTIDQLFSDLADNVTRREYRLRKGSLQYKYSLISVNTGFYTHIFSHCESEVENFLLYPKKKTKYEASYKALTVNELVQTKLYSKVNLILSKEASKIAPPDESAEIEINAYYTKRWKEKFDEIKINFNDSPKLFIESIYKLCNLNKKNPSIENIFFEASKFITKSDKEAALTFYIHYLYHDLKSVRFDNKQLTKTIQKSLFKTNEQLHDFETIVNELIKDKDLDKALKSVPKIYEAKRKKIQLDRASINDAQQQHAGTVELLNEYLKDDFEDETNPTKSPEINNEEINIQLTQKNEEILPSSFVSELALALIHTTALELFAKSNFSVAQSEFEAFAKSKGIFKNQLIESINDTCYEFLDDILIEEEDDYYTIDPNYYQRLLLK